MEEICIAYFGITLWFLVGKGYAGIVETQHVYTISPPWAQSVFHVNFVGWSDVVTNGM